MTLSTLTKCVTTNAVKSFAELEGIIFSHNTIATLLNEFQLNFNKNKLLIEAISHASFCNENNHLRLNSYERLEFLGDSLISHFFSEKLYQQFKELDEGRLSKLRASLVNKDALVELAQLVSVSDFVLVGKGEAKSEIGESVQADVFEAILGAIYLDHGWDKMVTFLEQLFLIYRAKNGYDFLNPERIKIFDPKSSLQERVISLYKQLPIYEAVETKDQNYHVKLIIKDEVVIEKVSHSKKKAERELAKEAIEKKLYILED
ncbi:MAG: ribonuclease III [Bdellovibrionales bacterium]|jgi:ribonuclease-3|nr:ribonuclease III [Bdellovibrionales bacterium]